MSQAAVTRPMPPASVRLSFVHVVASEWRKLFSLRSTWWILATIVVLEAGTAALLGAVSRVQVKGQPAVTFDASDAPGAGLQFSQLALVALAVLAITAEYSSGQIRVTLAAVPRRTPVLAAKAVVVTVVAAAVGLVGGALAVAVVTLIGGSRVGFRLPGAETARILAGTPLYLAAIALLSLAVGALMRHTAGAIVTLIAFLLIVQTVLVAIPWKPLQVISPWLPGVAGSQLLATDASVAAARAVPNHVGAVLDPWVGFAVLCGYAVVFLVAAVVTLRTRDA